MNTIRFNLAKILFCMLLVGCQPAEANLVETRASQQTESRQISKGRPNETPEAEFKRELTITQVISTATLSGTEESLAPHNGSPAIARIAELGRVAVPGRIVFSSEVDGISQIFTINADGSERQQLTNGPLPSLAPTWSPDGRTLAFVVHEAEDNWDIYMMNADGTNLTNLTRSPHIDFGPAWSPDGKTIAFSSLQKRRVADIYFLEIDSGKTTKLTSFEALALLPAWSADGTKISFVADGEGQGAAELYVVDVQTRETRPIFFDEDVSFDSLPFWAPEAALLTFMITAKQDKRTALWLIDATNLDHMHLMDFERGPFPPFAATWSPDGSYILFLARFEGGFVVNKVNVDGQDREQIITVPDIHPSTSAIHTAAWSPDGRQLAFISSKDKIIYVLDLVTGSYMPLSVEAVAYGDIVGPALTWQPRN